VASLALGGGDDLHRVEAEHRDVAVLAIADGLALVAAADRMRGVLNDLEAIALPQCMDGCHLAGLAAQVHRHHHLGQPALAGGDFKFVSQCLHRHVVAARVDVDEVHVGAAVAGAVGRCQEGDRRGPQHITRPQAEGHAGDVQRAGGAVDRHAVAGTGQLGDALFKCRNRRPLGQEVRPQHCHHGGDVGLGNVLPTVGDAGHQKLPILVRLASTHWRKASALIHSWLLSLA